MEPTRIEARVFFASVSSLSLLLRFADLAPAAPDAILEVARRRTLGSCLTGATGGFTSAAAGAAFVAVVALMLVEVLGAGAPLEMEVLGTAREAEAFGEAREFEGFGTGAGRELATS